MTDVDVFQPSAEAVAKIKEAEENMAIVVCDGHGNGMVLHHRGIQIAGEIEAMSAYLGDLGLDDAPEGLSVWEGCYVWHPGGFEHPLDGGTEVSGTFRPLTDVEWDAVRQGTHVGTNGGDIRGGER